MTSNHHAVVRTHHHTTFCGCLESKKDFPQKKNPLMIKTPPPLNRSDATLTDKDIVDLSKFLNADSSEDEIFKMEEVLAIANIYAEH
jgi:hypothetical protein